MAQLAVAWLGSESVAMAICHELFSARIGRPDGRPAFEALHCLALTGMNFGPTAVVLVFKPARRVPWMHHPSAQRG